jgi:hypothetical protein
MTVDQVADVCGVAVGEIERILLISLTVRQSARLLAAVVISAANVAVKRGPPTPNLSLRFRPILNPSSVHASMLGGLALPAPRRIEHRG